MEPGFPWALGEVPVRRVVYRVLERGPAKKVGWGAVYMMITRTLDHFTLTISFFFFTTLDSVKPIMLSSAYE